MKWWKRLNINHKKLYIKSGLFVLIAYLIVPFIFTLITKNLESGFQYNFFAFPVYSLAIVISFILFNRKELSESKAKSSLLSAVTFSLIAIFLFIIYFVIKFQSSFNSRQDIILIYLSYGLFYILGILFIALAIFGKNIILEHKASLLMFTLITYMFFILTKVMWNFWKFFSTNIVRIVYFILNLFSDQAIMSIGIKDPTLGLGSFKVIIGPACSGVESLLMYFGLFTLLIIYEWDNLKPKKTWGVFSIGLIGVYFMNVTRIGILILIGTKFPNFALGAFHSQAGWILFSAFMLILMSYGYKWMIKSKEEKEMRN